MEVFLLKFYILEFHINNQKQLGYQYMATKLPGFNSENLTKDLFYYDNVFEVLSIDSSINSYLSDDLQLLKNLMNNDLPRK